MPDVVKRLADDIQWTTDLGNAFLAQQSDVMDAVQRMRKKAQGTGALASNEQQKVETQVVESKTVIVVEQANPQVVYVPTYNPVVVYGPPIYPYPPIYYPYYPPGAVFTAGMIGFGVGIAIGAAWGGGGWGYGCGWGGNDIDINVNNNFVRNNNINHNTQHQPRRQQQVAAQRAASRRRAVLEPGHRRSIRRDRARRLARTAINGPIVQRHGAIAQRDNAVDRNRAPPIAARAPAPPVPIERGRRRPRSGISRCRELPVPASGAFSGSSGGGDRARATSSRGASSAGASRGGGGGGRRR